MSPTESSIDSPIRAGNDDVKKNDGSANDEDCQRVANAPENPGESGFQQVALATHDGGHGNHVIRIGGMAHTEEKADRDYGKKTDHGFNVVIFNLIVFNMIMDLRFAALDYFGQA